MSLLLPVKLKNVLPLLPIALLMLARPVSGQDIAMIHCEGKCPQYASDVQKARANIVVHHVFAAGMNNDTGLADWVAYRITKEAVGVASLLPRSWEPDRLVKFADAAEPVDVNSTVFSLSEIASVNSPYGGGQELAGEKEFRARLAPITSFANTPYWSDLNNLTNMVPMPNELRLGAWLQLEQALNELVATEDELFVVSGPLFLINQPLTTLATAGVDMTPAAYYKVIASKSGFAAFVFPENLPQHVSFCKQEGQLDQIERMTGLVMFPERDFGESSRLLAALGCH